VLFNVLILTPCNFVLVVGHENIVHEAGVVYVVLYLYFLCFSKCSKFRIKISAMIPDIGEPTVHLTHHYDHDHDH
jgi:hypothetical protein